MSEAGYVDVTCPHCTTLLRVRPEYAGQETRCTHPDCQRAVPVPFSLDEDEPDEPVLLPEDPADPEPVPIGRPASSAPPPRPRRKRRRHEDEPEPRSPVLPWALTTVALLLAAGAVMGWAVTATHTSSELTDATARAAALETANRDLRAENQKLRGQSGAIKPAAPAPKGPDGSAVNDPPPATAKPSEEPVPPKKPADDRTAFVGEWSITSEQFQRHGLELTGEFRADGTYTLAVKNNPAGGQQLRGRWRWDGRALHIDADNQPRTSRPAAVKWNGPDEFVASAANEEHLTFRRKATP